MEETEHIGATMMSSLFWFIGVIMAIVWRENLWVILIGLAIITMGAWWNGKASNGKKS